MPSAAHWACLQGNQALSWEGLGKFIVRLRASISPQPSPPHLTITGSMLRPWPGIKVPVTGPCSHPNLIAHHPSSPHILTVCTSPVCQAASHLHTFAPAVSSARTPPLYSFILSPFKSRWGSGMPSLYSSACTLVGGRAWLRGSPTNAQTILIYHVTPCLLLHLLQDKLLGDDTGSKPWSHLYSWCPVRAWPNGATGSVC